MPDCECLERCPFFNDKMVNRPATAEMFKKAFCLGDNTSCARYMIFVSLGPEAVPLDLFPNQVDRALGILKKTQLPR